MVRRVARVPREPEARLVLVARQRPTTGARRSPARRGSSTRRPRVLPAHLRALDAGPQLGERGGPRGRLLDDALVARPRGRRLPDGRHQLHLQGPLARRTGSICGPRIHEFMHEMHAAVFAGREEPTLTVGEMPVVTLEARAAASPTRRAREVDMVFQFEHVARPRGDEVGRARRCGSPTSSARSAAGRRGSRSAAGTRSTGTTTTSRGSSRASATTRRAPRRARRRCSARSCTCTAGRRTSTRARSSG